jgi:uncharacterized protein YjbI with pentapeptide repeats
LKNANLKFAWLEKADFTGADIRGANMENATFDEDTVFTNAKYDKKTIWPDKIGDKQNKAIFIGESRE